MDRYRIAELIVDLTAKYEPLRSQAKAYRYEGSEKAIADISISDSYLQQLRRNHPEGQDPLFEYLGTGSNFYTLLLSFQGMMLHASAVEIDGKAYLFSAPSGTGKSTHTALWLQLFGERARIINDDKPALRWQEETFFVYGTPWSGKTSLNINCKVPLQGIAFLQQSTENTIERISTKEALPQLLDQTVRPGNPNQYDFLLQVLEKLVQTVPIYRLHCNMDPEAAKVSYQAMKEGK